MLRSRLGALRDTVVERDGEARTYAGGSGAFLIDRRCAAGIPQRTFGANRSIASRSRERSS